MQILNLWCFLCPQPDSQGVFSGSDARFVYLCMGWFGVLMLILSQISCASAKQIEGGKNNNPLNTWTGLFPPSDPIEYCASGQLLLRVSLVRWDLVLFSPVFPMISKPRSKKIPLRLCIVITGNQLLTSRGTEARCLYPMLCTDWALIIKKQLNVSQLQQSKLQQWSLSFSLVGGFV